MGKKIFTVDYSFALKELNPLKKGISREELAKRLRLMRVKNRELFLERTSGKVGFYSLPYFGKEARKIKRFAGYLRRRFDRLVVLGIGGSALGASAALSGLEDRLRKGAGEVTIVDNIDPDRLHLLFSSMNLRRTVFNVISKSGGTSETVSEFLLVADRLKKSIGKDWKDHIIFTTDPEKGMFRELVEREGFSSFPVPPAVGGRFSVFSPVGLFPLAFGGVDISSLLEGARFVDGIALGRRGERNPVLLLSALYSYFIDGDPKNTFVLFTYSDFMDHFGEWFAQLWGESLGKVRKVGRRREPVGQTPVSVKGVTVQHSQLQLYSDGPDDKVYTFIGPGSFRRKMPVKNIFKDERVSYLSGKGISDLFMAEMEGTIYSLASEGRPVVLIEPLKRDAFTLGGLFYLFECITALTGRALDIDPFNQPGVEHGKKLAKAMLGDSEPGEFLEEVDYFRKLKGKHRIIVESK